MSPRRRKKPEKNLAHQTHTTVAPKPQEGRWYPQSRVERVKPNKAESRQHGAEPKRKLANCGKLRKTMVYDGHEFKPHLMGSWGQGPTHGMGHGAKSLTSISMLPPPLKKMRCPGRARTPCVGTEPAVACDPRPRWSMSLKRLSPRRRKKPDFFLAPQTHPSVAPKNATRREVVPTIQGRTCEAEQSGIKATRR